MGVGADEFERIVRVMVSPVRHETGQRACKRCGKPTPAGLLCWDCRVAARQERQRRLFEQRRKDRLCVECARAAEGYARCADCRQRAAEYQRRRNALRSAPGSQSRA